MNCCTLWCFLYCGGGNLWLKTVLTESLWGAPKRDFSLIMPFSLLKNFLSREFPQVGETCEVCSFKWKLGRSFGECWIWRYFANRKNILRWISSSIIINYVVRRKGVWAFGFTLLQQVCDADGLKVSKIKLTDHVKGWLFTKIVQPDEQIQNVHFAPRVLLVLQFTCAQSYTHVMTWSFLSFWLM